MGFLDGAQRCTDDHGPSVLGLVVLFIIAVPWIGLNLYNDIIKMGDRPLHPAIITATALDFLLLYMLYRHWRRCNLAWGFAKFIILMLVIAAVMFLLIIVLLSTI